MAKIVKNHGAHVMARLGMQDEDMAARTGLNRVQVTNYRNSKLKPKSSNRLLLERVLGIPRDAWDFAAGEYPAQRAADRRKRGGIEQPKTPRKPMPPEPPEVRAQADAVLQETEAMLQRVRDLGRAVDEDKTIDHRERARILGDITPLLAHLHKITGAALLMSEDRLMRLPAYRRIRDAIEGVLRRHPVALADFRTSMRSLADGGAA
jgi:transcriptional regulator with XRE-family HTH domain